MSSKPAKTRIKLAKDDQLKARVRADFESTDASIRELAARHGIRSENTIRRWRDNEGWQRDVSAITAELVTRAVAMGAEQQPLASPPIPRARADFPISIAAPGEPYTGAYPVADYRVAPKDDPHLKPPSCTPDQARQKRAGRKTAGIVPSVPEYGDEKPARGRVRTPGAEDSSEDFESGGPDVRSARTTAHKGAGGDDDPSMTHTPVTYRKLLARDAEDRRRIETAQGLAQIHAAAINKQLGHSNTLVETGLQMLANIQVLLEPTSSVDERGWAVARLTTVNRDKDTLTGLAKAAASLIKEGVALQRKALAMDVMGGDPNAAERKTSEAGELLKDAPPETLGLLRELIAKLDRSRPEAAATIEDERASARGPLMPPIEGEVIPPKG